jgi:prephenate dehydrogenase
VRELPPPAHDRLLAGTSHLPHVVAAALAATLGNEDHPFAATGFRDTTRIAAGDPELWTAILLQNADEVVHRIDHFAKSLDAFRAAVSQHNAPALRELLSRSKSNRDALNGSSNALGN